MPDNQRVTVKVNGGGCCGCLVVIFAIIGALYVLGVLQ